MKLFAFIQPNLIKNYLDGKKSFKSTEERGLEVVQEGNHQVKLNNSLKKKKKRLFGHGDRSPEDIVNSSRLQQNTSHSNFASLLSNNQKLVFYLILVTVLQSFL